MRELKFRAFNGKYMDEVVGYEYNCGSFDKDVTIVFDEKEGINAYLTKDLNVMQYIGLKDKNGKEIYEGDILSYKHIVYTDCSKTEIEKIEEEALIEIITYAPIASIVKPHSKNVKCNGYDRTNNQCLVIDLSSDDVEVIGNIYENKELLEM